MHTNSRLAFAMTLCIAAVLFLNMSTCKLEISNSFETYIIINALFVQHTKNETVRTTEATIVAFFTTNLVYFCRGNRVELRLDNLKSLHKRNFRVR